MSNDGLSIFDEEPTPEEESTGPDDATQVLPAVGKEQSAKSCPGSPAPPPPNGCRR